MAKKLTPEERKARNAAQRERYATDPAYAASFHESARKQREKPGSKEAQAARTQAYKEREKAKLAADPTYKAEERAAAIAKANEKRRNRYHSDPEFRERILAPMRKLESEKVKRTPMTLEERKAKAYEKHKWRVANEPGYVEHSREMQRALVAKNRATPEGLAKVQAKARGYANDAYSRKVEGETPEEKATRLAKKREWVAKSGWGATRYARAKEKGFTTEQRAAACAATRRWVANNKDRALLYTREHNNTPAAKESMKRWLSKPGNKKKVQAQRRERFRERVQSELGFAEMVNSRQRAWYAKPENNKRLNQKLRTRFQEDAQFRIGHNLRVRLRITLQRFNAAKTTSAIDVGCSLPELVAHMESLWTEGMSWANYGNKKDQWSIDHVRPLASFDMTDAEQQKAACHFTNLRPLWHTQNLSKGSMWNGTRFHRRAPKSPLD